jgi:hypothetical protein
VYPNEFKAEALALKEANEILKKTAELQFASSSHGQSPGDGVPVYE